MKIQFGCGGNLLDGWENHDADVDITRRLPFQDGCADACFAEHVSEHTTGPQCLQFFRECYRILKPGGWFRVYCPVIGPWLTRKHAGDLVELHGHLIVLDEHLMRTMLWIAGFDQQKIQRVNENGLGGHWRVIGRELDDLETCRMIAIK